MKSSDGIAFRTAGSLDVPDMAECRLRDPGAGVADPRMAAYFEGRHHPQKALAPRTGYVAVASNGVTGYIGGHLTTRYGCEGEVQYLFVASAWRRRGIAAELLRLLAFWFVEQRAERVCVCVDVESPAAIPFYEHLGAQPLFPPKKYWYGWERIEVLAAANDPTND